jgi:hypothetical protein
MAGQAWGMTSRPPSPTDSMSLPVLYHDGVVNSKMNERTGNVYENKGSLWKTRERSANVYENKGG